MVMKMEFVALMSVPAGTWSAFNGNLEFSDFLSKGIPIHAKKLCGLDLIPIGFLKS